MKRLTCILLVVLGALALVPETLSALELNRYFSDGMVLQRDKALKIWGTAKKGDTITVRFAGQTVKTTAGKDGRWSAALKPISANPKGRTLNVDSTLAKHPLKVDDVVVGDVFLFARQSSIDVSLGTTPEGRKAASALAANKAYRFIRIKTTPARTPLDNLKADATKGWQTVDKKAGLTMSAAAFYLGRDLVKEADVPIGIVDLDMGHHFGAAWLSAKGLKLALDRNREGKGHETLAFEMKCQQLDYEVWDKRIIGHMRRKRLAAYRRGSAIPAEPVISSKPLTGLSPTQRPICPSVCHNAVVRPLQGLVVKGMLLQHGNDYPYFAFEMLPRKHANSYIYEIIKGGNAMTPNVLPVAVDDLRSSLGDPSLPMAWIMPPGSDNQRYAYHNREVRELQRRIQAENKGVDLILPGSQHIDKSGQPADEALLANRCKQWVMGTFYGAKAPVSGPLFERVEYANGTATVSFEAGTAVGLSAKGDALEHFEVAGEDGDFVPCKARIKGESITLTSDAVSKPMHVRYGWNHKPGQGLVNSAGLPAIPFNSDATWEYDWWPAAAPAVLPDEYRTTVDKWSGGDVMIHNASAGAKQHIGPTGIWAAPFGPNLKVNEITPGSPADGKVLKDDMIYGANGKVFLTTNQGQYRGMAAAITAAETEAGGGKLTLMLRRSGKLIEVPIQLAVMGSFSATTPWDCEKSRRIVERAEEYMHSGLRPETGFVRTGDYVYGEWYDNVLFLLASGNPKMQGLVRRAILENLDAGRGWGGYMTLLQAEYYHRTGDPTVLPSIRKIVDSWKLPEVLHPWFGGMPAGELMFYSAMVLAKEAGLKVDEPSLRRALDFWYYGRAEFANIMYYGYKRPSPHRIEGLVPMDPKEMATGTVRTWNGKRGTAAALFSLVEGKSKAVKACSARCAYAFNRTQGGHGGAWFNNFWTPIGAYHAGEKDYQRFMKGQQWWRELYRDHTGAVWQHWSAKQKKCTLGVGYVIHRVAHHKRLRLFGAPRSAFGPGAPACLKEALAAHGKRDYALAVKLARKALAEREIPAGEKPTVQHFLEAVETLEKSVEYDLSYTEDRLKKKQFYLASLELPQLKMVVAPGNARLKAIATALESAEAKKQIAAINKQARDEPGRIHGQNVAARKKIGPMWKEELARIVTLVKDGGRYSISRRQGLPTYPEEEWNRWRVDDFETRDHAPEKWQQPDFDDSSWDETTLPTIWRPGHTGLLRTTFEVKDANVFESLTIRTHGYKITGLKVYLNGHVVAKVNNMRGGAAFKLTPYATTLLKNGVNTLAVSAEHGMRWVSFSLRMEGRLKEIPKVTTKGGRP